jgi:hypothetical protein
MPIIEFFNLDTIWIDGVEAGTYDKAYQDYPDLRPQLWEIVMKEWQDKGGLIQSLTEQLNQCRLDLENCQGQQQ